MGSVISLGVGRLELDWGKNWHFNNHSKLFLPVDTKPVPYYYVNDDDPAEITVEYKNGYARPLHSVVRRLELLGYTLPNVREMYEGARATVPDFYDEPEISFDLFRRALTSVDVTRFELGGENDDYDLGEYVADCIMKDPEFTKPESSLFSLSRHDGAFLENLDPYIALRLLAENPGNLSRDLEWRCADIIEAGWTTPEEIFIGLERSDQLLVVTEGSTDAAIIRKAFDQLTPDIADFFTFIDMAENYPFTGTGNLFRFAQGLAKIGIQNKVLIVFDNDAAGVEAFQRTCALDLPANVRVTRLPDIDECRNFPTIGPDGEARVDINGKAAAIEIFLDHRRVRSPIVRWTAYNTNLGVYQGELQDKGVYAKDFLRGKGIPADYDCKRVRLLLEHLYQAIVGAAQHL